MKALLILFTLLGHQKCFRFRHNYRSASHARVMPSAPPPLHPPQILRFRGIHCEHLYIRTSCAFVPTLTEALVRLRTVKIYMVDYPKHIIIV